MATRRVVFWPIRSSDEEAKGVVDVGGGGGGVTDAVSGGGGG